MGYKAEIHKLMERMRLHMPVQITLPDPVTGKEFTVSRENLMSLLSFNPESLTIEAQLVAPLYMEMARLQRAAEVVAAKADVTYVRWKAQRAAERRNSGEKVTEKAVEESYRNHEEYLQYAEAPKYWEAVANLFEDAKWAFRMKSAHIEGMHRSIGGHESTERVSREGETDEDRLEELAGSIFDANAGEREKAMAQYWATERSGGTAEMVVTSETLGPDVVESFVDDEDDEDDEDDDEDFEIPPEAPKKKSRKKKKKRSKKRRARNREES